MEFTDVVRGRRSVRKYKNQKVDRKILEEILEDATWAPSGVNIQPWYFVVAESDEAKARVKVLMKEAALRCSDHLRARFTANPEIAEDSLGFIANMGNAPVIVMAFQGKDEYPLMEEGVVQSVAAAIENLTLSAYNKGLGTCWMTAPMQADLDYDFRDEFAKEKSKLIAIITLGYPEEGAVPKAPKRKENRVEFI